MNAPLPPSLSAKFKIRKIFPHFFQNPARPFFPKRNWKIFRFLKAPTCRGAEAGAYKKSAAFLEKGLSAVVNLCCKILKDSQFIVHERWRLSGRVVFKNRQFGGFLVE
jgi:hypothetical protein